MRNPRRWLATLCGCTLLSAPLPAADWPQFRGPSRDNISQETGLLRQWPEGGPEVLWTTAVCQGYAAAAIHSGRVYFNDYDRQANQWYVRCLTLAEGRELWRFKESKRIRPNHGITRTVPAVDGQYVFSLDPKCVFHCLDAKTGEELWQKSLVRDYGARIPPWYNGQCPLIEPDRVVIAVGGDALMVALDKATGNEIWRTPNPDKWPLAHASVMPAQLGGVKQYLWCTLKGLLGVRAADGELLWHHARKFNVAVAPSPLFVGGDCVFMTAGYDAGSIMLRVESNAGHFTTTALFDFVEDQWSSDVHTPIFFENHLFAVSRKKRGLFTCLDLDGNVVWDSGGKASFELGSFILADGMFFVLEGKTGMLRLLDANTAEYRELDRAQVLSGHDVWGPIALSDGKMVLRDMKKMACIEVGGAGTSHRGASPPQPGASRPQRGASPPPGHSEGAQRPRNLTSTARGGQIPRSPAEGRFGRNDGRVRPVTFVGSADCSLTMSTNDEPNVQYRKTRMISGRGPGPQQFAEALRGLAIDGEERIYAVGDSKLVVFSPSGQLLRSWPTERPGHSVAVAAEGTVYVGQEGQIEIFDQTGKLLDTWRDADRLGLVTAIGLTSDSVLVADVKGRCIRRCDKSGSFRNDIGKDNRMRGFVLPNRHLDFALDATGIIHAANPGRHRVERYTVEGKLLGHFGRFDGQDPAGFTGCCNPTNVALTPQGHLVTAEKADPRLKVYDADRKLLAVLGKGDFDLNCKNMDVGVDSHGRIHVIDTVRLHICVYAPEAPAATTQPASAPAATKVQP